MAERQHVKTQLLPPAAQESLPQGWDFPFGALTQLSRALSMNTATRLPLAIRTRSPRRMHGLSPDNDAVPMAHNAPRALPQQDLLSH